MGLRSLGQVIFIKNPVSGLLLLALFWQSPAMGLLSALGIAAANVTARLIGCDRGARLEFIYGFNGAWVGSAVAALASFDPEANVLVWFLAVVAGAGLTTLLVESLGRWLVKHLGLPPLNLPFCLVTCQLLGIVTAANHRGLLAGGLRSFGQVFLCAHDWPPPCSSWRRQPPPAPWAGWPGVWSPASLP